jgi:putative lipoprotein
VVETHVEIREIALMRRAHLGYHLRFRAAFLSGAHHDRRAVRVVRADVSCAMAAEALKSDPDVGLDVLDEVPEMDVTVCVGQSARDEKASVHDVGRVIASLFGARRAPLKTLLALCFFAGTSAATSLASADSFWGPDKALHFGVSAGLAGGGYAASSLVWQRPWQRALAGATLSLSAGVAKELWDLSGHGDPSFKDLAWDGIGTGVGVALATAVDVWLIRSSGDTSSASHGAALVLRW